MKIVEGFVRHWVEFGPDAKSDAAPMTPQRVKTRLIEELAEFPKGARRFSFYDTVQTVLLDGDGQPFTVMTQPFNRSPEYLIRSAANVVGIASLRNRGYVAIRDHPHPGEFWVLQSPAPVVAETA